MEGVPGNYGMGSSMPGHGHGLGSYSSLSNSNGLSLDRWELCGVEAVGLGFQDWVACMASVRLCPAKCVNCEWEFELHGDSKEVSEVHQWPFLLHCLRRRRLQWSS